MLYVSAFPLAMSRSSCHSRYSSISCPLPVKFYTFTWLLVVQNLGVGGLPVPSAIPLVGFRKFDVLIFASTFHAVIQIKMISALQKCTEET